MTKNENIVLFKHLQQLGNLSGVKFSYTINKNIQLLEGEIKALEKTLDMSDEYKEFDKKRIKLAEKYSKKDEKGKPIIKDNNYELENAEEFNKAFKTLQIENQELWDAREKQVNEYNELLKTESEVVLHKVNITDVPQNISVAQMNGIMSIVAEDVPSPYK